MMTARHPAVQILVGALAAVLLSLPLRAQEKPHALAIHAQYTSASRIFPTPFSQNPVLQIDSYEIGSAFSFAGDYRYTLAENLQAGLSFEYLPNEMSRFDGNGTEFVEGYRLYMLELSGYFILPVGSKTVRLYVGGGVGGYVGERIYSVAGIDSRVANSVPAFGIHVLSGLEYFPVSFLSLRAQFHFRDPQIVAENYFEIPVIRSNGIEYPVSTRSFKSKVNINGNVYGLGVVFHF